MKSFKEFIVENFNFKGALKTGMLEKGDEKYVKELEKKGWKVVEFNLTSKGYEVFIQKGAKKEKFVDSGSPSKALATAAKKAR